MTLFDTASRPDRSTLSRIVLAADPGKSGALALLGDDDLLLAVMDMPDADGHELTAAILSAIGEHEPYLPTVAWLEFAQAMPDHLQGRRQGSASVFNYGRNFGALEGACAAFGIPVHLVRASTWKAWYPDVTKDKDTSRAKAAALWPMHAHLFKRKKDDGRAEAALIAYYGAQRHLVHRAP